MHYMDYIPEYILDENIYKQKASYKKVAGGVAVI